MPIATGPGKKQIIQLLSVVAARIPLPPPVAPSKTLSPPIRQPEKTLFSKEFGGEPSDVNALLEAALCSLFGLCLRKLVTAPEKSPA